MFPLAAAAFAYFSAMMVLQFAFAWRVMPEIRVGTPEDVERRLSNRPGRVPELTQALRRHDADG